MGSFEGRTSSETSQPGAEILEITKEAFFDGKLVRATALRLPALRIPWKPRKMKGNDCGKGLLQAMPKEKIHPNYAAVRVLCACGSNFETRSTHKCDIHVEICSVCHPFFTGKQRLVDTAGRVERFRRKYAKSDKAMAAK